MDPVIARKMSRTLEPYHGVIYFLPEAAEAYAARGVEGRDGYFVSRSAPLGRVNPNVVIATFFNFNPDLITHALPRAWDATTPEAMVEARLEAIDRGLRRLLGDAISSPEMRRAAELARTASAGCRTPGRPLYAGHADLDWPTDSHLVLWHALSLIREFRGDGHIACLVAEELDAVEALVTHAASGAVPRVALQTTRAWTDDDWAAGVERLASRGLVHADGEFTADGVTLRQRIEDRTDDLALPAWDALGEDGCQELRELVRPWSKAISTSDAFTSALRGR
ncbi:MAG TPA: hypothetical protein VGZ52_00435 [Acidimicrobiales bacterium]|jgi:hypothetical protein|nr:hypothetical protein [Acidimicrobiales bacterium]